ncbi:MAG: ABC transporter permease [Bacteroidetes bacterium]|nr:ABC transporter permease [Bacteroidota bacterium]
MLVNYILTAFRYMRRRLGFTLINVLGLALGIASCLLIFLVVRYELGYDAFNTKADRIYRVNHHSIDYNPRTSPVVAPAMRNDFPELQVAEFFYNDGIVKVGNDRYNESNYAFADEYVPGVFDYQWIAGDSRTALAAPNSIVLTEKMAHKYFGTKDAMGQVINLDNQWNCKVTGIIKDLPGNTSLPLPFMVSMSTIKKELSGMNNYYSIPGGNFTYIALPQNYSIERVRSRIHSFMEKNWGKDIAKEATLILQPLRDVHFEQQYLYHTVSPTTSRQTYWALAGIALFIIITACINFINLATGQSASRSKEVGVRKVLGARRPQLIGQFLGETAIQVIVAMLLGVLIAILLISRLKAWLDIGISTNELLDAPVVLLLTILTLLLIPVAGLYPAFVQSAFQPALSLKGASGISRRSLLLRRGLVVLQFGISQLMIIGTIIVARQMDFFRNRDLGFNKDFVISFFAPDSTHQQTLLHQLTTTPGIAAVSLSSGAPTYSSQFTGFDAPQLGVTGENITEVKCVDENFTRMFGLTMLAGDTISKRTGKDSISRIVVNETLIERLNIHDPRAAIGQNITVSGEPAQIIGVVKDFQSESKHKKRRACVLLYNDRQFYSASVRIMPAGMRTTIAHIEKMWSALYPDLLFEYEFLDDHIASFYRQEEKFYTAFRIFSFIAIFIGCLGLYGLIAFATLQRTREIGIRKVLGASIPGILLLFAREFIWLILLAFIVSAPVAWMVMHSWLDSFAYRIGIGWETFLVSIGASLLIAAFTISYKTITAALMNPVQSLRME